MQDKIHTTPASAEPTLQTPTHKRSQIKAVIWRGLKIVAEVAYQTPAEVMVIALAAVIFCFLYPPVAYPLFGAATSTFITRVAVKLTDHYNPRCLDKVKKPLHDFNGKYPVVRFVALIASVALSCLSEYLGLGCGIVLGTLSGITLEAELVSRRRALNRKEKNSYPNQLEAELC